jgi:drug/metabolite transporter (DMT)-like permease
MTYLFAVLAALSNAGSEVLQRKANKGESESTRSGVRAVVDLLRRPVWLAGFLGVIAGFLLQAAALRHGALAVVEPTLMIELPLTLGLGAAVFKRRLGPREWVAIALMTAGLALLIGSLGPTGGSALRPDGLAWAVGMAALVLVVAALVVRGLSLDGQRRAAWLGVATGTSVGLTATLVAVVSSTFAGGPTAIFTIWQTYAMALTGLGAMYLLQTTLRTGTLAAAQPGITLSDPLVSVAWGVAAYGETVRTGWWILSAVSGGVLVAAGTVLLSRSSVMADFQEPAAD